MGNDESKVSMLLKFPLADVTQHREILVNWTRPTIIRSESVGFSGWIRHFYDYYYCGNDLYTCVIYYFILLENVKIYIYLQKKRDETSITDVFDVLFTNIKNINVYFNS